MHGALSFTPDTTSCTTDPIQKLLCSILGNDAGSTQLTDDELRESFRNMIAASGKHP